MIEHTLFEPLVHAIGWTLLHSLWQGAAIAIPLAFLLAGGRCTPRTRYLLSAIGLLLTAAMAVITFISMYRPSGASPSAAVSIPAVAAGTTSAAAHGTPGFPHLFTTTVGASLDTTMPVIAAAWLIGILLFTVKFLAELAHVRRIRSHHTITVAPFWQQRFVELCHKVKVSPEIRLAESAVLQVPIVIGVLRPVVLLPLGTLVGLPALQVEALLAHELAHIRRHDYLINMLQTVMEILFFYHPAVWWLSSRMRVEREHCCDDIAVAVSGSSVALARALAELQERALAPRPVLAATGRRHHLLDRIRRIVEQPNTRSTPVERGVAVGILTATLLIMSISARASLFQHTTPAEADSATARPDRVVSEQSATLPDPVVSAEQPNADESPDHVDLPLGDAMRESTSGTVTNLTTDIDNNGKRQRISVQLGTDGNIIRLTVDGKEIPPSEFAPYQTQIDEAVRQHKEALREQEKALREQEKALAEQEKALAEQEKALREHDRALQEQEKALAEHDEAMKTHEAHMRLHSEALEQQGKLLEQQALELEKRSRMLEEKIMNMEKEGNLHSQHRSREQLGRERTEQADTRSDTERRARAQEREGRAQERENRARDREARAKEREQQSRELQSELETELIRDNLISSKDKYEFRLTSKELYINGKKQPQALCEKYKKLYSTHMQVPVGEGFIIQIQK